MGGVGQLRLVLRRRLAILYQIRGQPESLPGRYQVPWHRRLPDGRLGFIHFLDIKLKKKSFLFIFSKVESTHYMTPLGSAFIQGGVEMGYKNRDCNGEFQTGFMFAQVSNIKTSTAT